MSSTYAAIYNSILSRLSSYDAYAVAFDANSGEMTVLTDESRESPSVSEIGVVDDLWSESLNKIDGRAQERSSWAWTARVNFDRHIDVDEFMGQVADSWIVDADAVAGEGNFTIRVESSRVEEPPRQDGGTTSIELRLAVEKARR